MYRIAGDFLERLIRYKKELLSHSRQFFVSIPTENVRKPFLAFSGGREMEKW